MSRHPIVKWAQRADRVYITVELPDAADIKLKLEPEGNFFFSATGGTDKAPYEVKLELFAKVDVNESKASINSRNICYLVKKAESKWWSRLIKQEGKSPVFLKVDWDKWVDEDEEEDKPGADMDFGDFDFSGLNMGDGGGGAGDEEDESDSEDEVAAEETKAPEAAAEGENGGKAGAVESSAGGADVKKD